MAVINKDDWTPLNTEQQEILQMNLSNENYTLDSLSYILTKNEVIANSVFYAFMIPLAISGNVLSIAVSSKILTKRNSCTDLLIGFLAFSDLLNIFGIHTFSIISLVAGHWVGGLGVCGTQYYMAWSCLKFSFFILVMLTIDRYIALVKPLRYRSLVTSFRIKVGILGVFIFSFGSTLITVIGYSDTIGIVKGWYICMNNWSTSSIYYITILVVYGLTYVGGLAVFGYCNIVVAVQLCLYSTKGSCRRSGKNSGRNVVLMQRPSLLGKRQKKERKAARIILLISLLFFIFWAPYFVTIVMTQLGNFIQPEVMVNALRLLFANAFINPLIYACFNKTYRRGFLYFTKLFLYYLFCKCCTQPEDDNIFFERRSWRQEVIRVMKAKEVINNMSDNSTPPDETHQSRESLPDVIILSSSQTNPPESVNELDQDFDADDVQCNHATKTPPITISTQDNSNGLVYDNMVCDITDGNMLFRVEQDETSQPYFINHKESYDTCL